MRNTISIRSGGGIGRPFRFGLPQGPMSFQERLVSVKWAIDLVARAGKDTVRRRDLVVTPTDRPLKLEELTSDPKRRKGLFRLERR